MELTLDQALQQAVAAHREGKLQDAERLYRAILQAQPNNPDANHNLGVLAVAVGKASEALPLFKLALDANPKIEQFWLSYINLLVSLERFDDANEVILNGRKAALSEKKLRSIETEIARALLDRQRREREQSNHYQNRKGFSGSERFHRKKSRGVASRGKPSARKLNRLMKYYKGGQFDLAEEIAVSITEKYPSHQIGWKGLGAVLLALGKDRESLIALKRCVELAPEDAESHNNLGIAYKRLGMLAEAALCFDRALVLAPELVQGHLNLGNTLRSIGRLDEAVESLGKAISLRADHAESHESLGVTLQQQGKSADAERSLRRAIALNPDYSQAYVSLGYTLRAVGKSGEAEANYKLAIALNESCAQAHHNLGVMLFELGRYEEAMRHLAASDFEESRRYEMRCSYMSESESVFLSKLDDYVSSGCVNPVVGSLVCCARQRYGVDKANPFCADPQNYVVKTDLSVHTNFENVFVMPARDILQSRMRGEREQVLLTNGMQTNGNIFTERNFREAGVEDAIRTEIEKYRSYFKDSEEGLIKSWPENYELLGWLVVMNSGGQLDAHMHPSGWISGSVYINVPEKLEVNSGNLVLCAGDRESEAAFPNREERIISVKTGDLCLFPSSLHHYTIPFVSAEQRVVLAFDVMPK